jgi:hypothetical protein
MKKYTDEELIEIAVSYFPDALAEVGELCVVANEKHNPGEPIHWSKDKSNDHWGSRGRHSGQLGKIDPESGLLHDVSWLWRTLAINQVRLDDK